MILGYFDPTAVRPWPRIRAGLLLPGITTTWAAVDFVLDTGAMNTCVHPRDAIHRLGISTAMLMDPSQWPSVTTCSGIGGDVQYFTVPAQYALIHDDRQVEVIDGQIDVGRLTASNQALPSLLGWDLLEQFQIVLDHAAGRVELRGMKTP